MKIIRSSKCSFKFLTEKKRQVLYEIMDEYSRAVNFFIELFWQNEFSKFDIKKDILKLYSTWLTARMKQNAAFEALGMCQANNHLRNKSNLELEVEQLLDDNTAFDEKVKPHHNGKKMTLSSSIATIEDSKNSFDLWVKLGSIGRKIKIMIPLKKHTHFNKFNDWKRSSSVVVGRNYIQFSFKKETGSKKKSGKLVGFDMGINHLITTSEREFLGNGIKSMIGTVKRKKQGSKAFQRAKHTLKCYMHKTVKDYFNDNDLQLVVVEKLKNLKRFGDRSRGFNKTLNSWNYRQLLDIIQKHSEENRVSFRSVSAYYTSQKCPECSHIQRENRDGENFKCLKCGFSEQADYVGSLNIRDRFLMGPYGAHFKTEIIL